MLRAVASEILSGTWANKPSSAANGSIYYASDVGEAGTLFQYGASRWRALGGVAALKTLGANTAAINNSETNVIQALLPAGAWQQYDTIRLWGTATMSGATDAGNLTVRVGTAGTTGDTAITGLSAFQLITATGVVGSWMFDIKLQSATSAQKLGINAVNSHGYQSGTSTSTGAAATTITDASANALYVSVNLASAGATNTITATSAQIQLITP